MSSPGAGRPAAYHAGRLLQGAGLVLLPVGLYFGVLHDQGMTTELTLLMVGAIAFVAGTVLLRGSSD